ncbi:Mg-chelatase subunit ChlI [Cesiribacter andamanensis AMV16]|uniref:Mg-chelatase subunit ChlI n=2 Tax=Cesiribacter TaxID=1133570 RepID=M7NV62_9BACT|nr:Mg-chelatase subunit ChlI [Cesiribacter andamanensis AMV16]
MLSGIKTLGDLKAAGYQTRSIKDELRDNLIKKLQTQENPFPGILGYEETVLPDLQRAILSRHHINLLGLRGQAKTRIARLMVNLLDEYIPYLQGTDLLEDPLNPISHHGLEMVADLDDEAPIAWLHRSERYTEKLATPDVTVADLIGDVDPIKAASLRLSYSDERVIHYGLVPRSNRCIFVINELPDLQPRIQVALFNILQEGDIQIRGFKLRLPLDIQFVFTANPEDYTNRGSIVTPLKDRIDSQIITHYPKSLAIGKAITQQEAQLSPEQQERVKSNELIKDLVEQVAFEARESEYVDPKSGVSARLTISAYENLISAAERRSLLNGEKKTHVRVGDLVGIIPAVTGKIELVYEGEQEGAGIVAQNLLGKAMRTQFLQYFPNPKPEKGARAAATPAKTESPYKTITDWFGEGHTVDLLLDASDRDYRTVLESVPGLQELVKRHHPELSKEEHWFMMEFVLHGLAEYSMLSKKGLATGTHFSDLLSSMFSMPGLDSLEEEDEDDDF